MAVRSAFAINARAETGGQGQFLSLMVRALGGAPATIFSRGADGAGPDAVNVPFRGPRRRLFDVLRAAPYLRGRQDWLTLLSDVQFDQSVAAHLHRASAPALFDGVMGQCAESSRAAARGGARVVLTSLNTHIVYLRRAMDQEYARTGDRGRHFVHPRMEQRALAEIAAADHIRVNSNFAKSTFVDAGCDPSRISVIYPAIDLAHFREIPRADDTFRVMAVASIDPRKGIHDLIAGFADAALPNAELEIIGGSSDRWSRRLIADAIARHANIRVRALDISAVPVSESYGRASVLVHPAVEDGFGLVVAQALASGRPVIASSTTGASELIRHGENGFIVPPRSSREIAEHLKTLSGDRDLLHRMSAAARPSVTHLTFDAFGRAVREMYDRLR